MNLKKIIKEELFKEVGGYDSQNVMNLHAGVVMSNLSNAYNGLTNTLEGLANAVLDGYSKLDIVTFLNEVSEEIDLFISVVKIAIADFTEDDLILKAKDTIKQLESFNKKIDVIFNFSDAMGSGEEFIDRVKMLLMDLIPYVQKFGDQLQITNKLFSTRSSNHRGSFGFN